MEVYIEWTQVLWPFTYTPVFTVVLTDIPVPVSGLVCIVLLREEQNSIFAGHICCCCKITQVSPKKEATKLLAITFSNL